MDTGYIFTIKSYHTAILNSNYTVEVLKNVGAQQDAIYIIETKLLHSIGRAIEDFRLIEHGDRLLVGLSGGKDSWTMLYLLDALRKKAPINFSIKVVTIHPGFPEFNTENIEHRLKQDGFDYLIKKTHIKDIIAEKRKPGTSFCSFCARLRRGALYTVAQELNCNKVVLGHHRDDAIETLLLNQFFSGRIKAMPPRLAADDGKNIVVRPMIYAEEDKIAVYAGLKQFPILRWFCPITTCGGSERHRAKELLTELEKKYPGLKSSMTRALSNVIPAHLLDKKLYPALAGEERP